MRRREFLKVAATAPLALFQPASTPEAKICLFTDHLADFDYREVATMLRQVGIGGADLTVRPGGLVKPERVVEDLPKATRDLQFLKQQLREAYSSPSSG